MQGVLLFPMEPKDTEQKSLEVTGNKEQAKEIVSQETKKTAEYSQDKDMANPHSKVCRKKKTTV